jgi:hypothetical protein
MIEDTNKFTVKLVSRVLNESSCSEFCVQPALVLDSFLHLSRAFGISIGRDHKFGLRWVSRSLRCVVLTCTETQTLAKKVGASHATETEASFELGHERAARRGWGLSARIFSLGGQNTALPALDTPKTEDRGQENEPTYMAGSVTIFKQSLKKLTDGHQEEGKPLENN